MKVLYRHCLHPRLFEVLDMQHAYPHVSTKIVKIMIKICAVKVMIAIIKIMLGLPSWLYC